PRVNGGDCAPTHEKNEGASRGRSESPLPAKHVIDIHERELRQRDCHRSREWARHSSLQPDEERYVDGDRDEEGDWHRKERTSRRLARGDRIEKQNETGQVMNSQC